MNFSLFFSGAFMGFMIAAPVGPIGIFCMHRTLSEGRGCGLAAGIGAAAADTIYACLAVFGLVFISDTVTKYQMWFSLGLGIFLCYLGARIFKARPAEVLVGSDKNGLAGAFTSSFFLTIANPMTIFYFLAIFAAFKIATGGTDHIYMATLISGIFIGSVLCWVILTIIVSLFRIKLQGKGLCWLNRVSGVIISLFGILILFKSFY